MFEEEFDWSSLLGQKVLHKVENELYEIIDVFAVYSFNREDEIIEILIFDHKQDKAVSFTLSLFNRNFYLLEAQEYAEKVVDLERLIHI